MSYRNLFAVLALLGLLPLGGCYYSFIVDKNIFPVEKGDLLLPFISANLLCTTGSDILEPSRAVLAPLLAAEEGTTDVNKLPQDKMYQYILTSTDIKYSSDPPGIVSKPVAISLSFHKLKDGLYAITVLDRYGKENIGFLVTTATTIVVYDLNDGIERTNKIAAAYHLVVDKNTGHITGGSPDDQKDFIMEVASGFPSEKPFFSCRVVTT